MTREKRLFGTRVHSHRGFYALLLGASLAALVTAMYLQLVDGLAPCPLCILQRFGFIWLAVFALIGLLRGRLGALGNSMALLGGLAGTGVAVYHNWLLMNPADGCVFKDPVHSFVNELPTATWWPVMFRAEGGCTDALPPLLGLGIPQWALIGLTLITVGFFVRLLRR